MIALIINTQHDNITPKQIHLYVTTGKILKILSKITDSLTFLYMVIITYYFDK